MVDRTNFMASGSKYLTRGMFPTGKGRDLTIRDVREQTFQADNGVKTHKLVLDWIEEVPPMTLNKTNFNWLVSTFGGDDDKWIRKRVRVWHDPTVEYKGQRVGGLVLDQPRNPNPAQVPEKAPEPVEDLSDDIPF